MKKIICLVQILFVSFTAVFAQGLERIIVEEIPVSSSIASVSEGLSEDAICYRIFVDFKPDYGLSVVTGTENSTYNAVFPLSISTTTEFYNTKSWGTAFGDDLMAGAAFLDSGIVYDSYISVGGAASDRIGVPLEVNEAGYISGTPVGTLTTPGLSTDLSASFGSTTTNVNFYTEDGSWNGNVTEVGGVKGPMAGDSTIVFIGQFTTDGEFSFNLNIQLIRKVSSSVLYIESYVGLSEEWVYGNPTTEPVIQYSMLNNVFGPDITAPTVNITSPEVDTSIPRNVPFLITADANDTDGEVKYVEFRVNSIVIGVDSIAPYEFLWKSVEGVKNIQAVAVDNDGAKTISEGVDISSYGDNNSPVVGIQAPEDDAVFTQGEIVNITVLAEDPDEYDYVDTVSFFINGELIGIDLEEPFELSWEAVPVGTHTLSVVASDTWWYSGTDKINITVELPNELPTVSISSPANDSEFNENDIISFVADASDSDGSIDSVVFLVNGNRIGVAATAPYTYDWTCIQGNHIVTARAYDNDVESTFSDAVSITVNGSGTAPVVNITSPNNEDVVITGGIVTITTEVTDDGYVDSVQFYINNVKAGVVKTPPFEYTWTPIQGENLIYVIAFDDEQISSKADSVTIFVNSLPSVAIIKPVYGDSIVEGGTLFIEASATDDDGVIDSVVFMLNNKIRLGTTQDAPYNITVTQLSPGIHEIKSIAYDNDLLSNSATVEVKVISNHRPSVVITNPADKDTLYEGEQVFITADADDDNGVDSVVFYIDNKRLGFDDSKPFGYTWSPDKGNYIITVVAFDEHGLSSRLLDTVRVYVKERPLFSPEISISNPPNGSTFAPKASITITVGAVDSDGTIDSVEVFLNSTRLGVMFTSPYDFRWLAQPGSYTVKAVATDNDGLRSDTSIVIDVSGLSVKQIEKSTIAGMYPNPVSSILTVEFTADEYVKGVVSVYDITGTLKLARPFSTIDENHGIKLDMSGLTKGIYLVKIAFDEQVVVKKLIKE